MVRLAKRLVLLTAALIVSLSACGSDGKSAETTATIAATTTATPTTEATTTEATTTEVTTTTEAPATTQKPECVLGATENRNVTAESFDVYVCRTDGKWHFQKTVAATTTTASTVPASAMSPEEFTAALDPAVAAWVATPSPETYSALAATAADLAKPGRVLPDSAVTGNLSLRGALEQLVTYPGNDAAVYSTLGGMQALLPSLPPIIRDGNYTVGQDVQPGKYKTLGPVRGCYWETLDDSGEINDNNFVNAAPQVIATIRKSDFAFNSDDCGPWIKIG